MKLGSDPLAYLGEPLKEAEGNWDDPGDIDAGDSDFGEPVPPQGHWCWQVLF